jgi:hypothetical protein
LFPEITAMKNDEWRALGITAALGLLALVTIAWLSGMFSPI